MAKAEPPRELTTREGCEALLVQYGNIAAIADGLPCSQVTVRRYFKEHGVEWDHSPTNEVYRARMARIEKCFEHIPPYPGGNIAMYPSLDKQRRSIWKKWRKVRKVLVISDTHHPYMHKEHVKEMLRRDGDADLGVIAGDFFHAESFSPFPDKQTFAFEVEWGQGLEVLADLEQFFPMVVMRANHERRLEKAIRLLPRDAAKYVLERTPNLVQALIGDLHAKLGRKPKVDGLYDTWLKIGDAVIAHADDFSQIPVRTACNVADFMRINWQDIGIGDLPRAVVQAHTHHQGKTIWQGAMCFETGCLCHDADYRRLGKLGPGKKARWQRGYVVLEFDGKGKSDVNASRFVALDFQ